MAEETGWGSNCCEKVNVQMQRADYMQKEPDPQSATTSSGSQPKSLVTFYPKRLGHHSQKQPASPYCVPLPTGPITEGQTLSPSQSHRMPFPFWFVCLSSTDSNPGHTLIDPSLYPLQSFPTLFTRVSARQ